MNTVKQHLYHHSLALLCLLLQLASLLDLACLLGVLPAPVGTVDITASRNPSRTWNSWMPPLSIVATMLENLQRFMVEAVGTILRPIGIVEEEAVVETVAATTIIVVTATEAAIAALSIVVIVVKVTTEMIALLVGTMSHPLLTATMMNTMITRLWMRASLVKTIAVVVELWSRGTAGSGPR